jgi:CPA1 family monovalent cation:H+ antiporter
VFLPALIFEAAWNVDAGELRRAWRPVTMLAVPGVILTALLVAGGLAALGLLPFVPALVLGAILAATDPIAVIATFRRLGVDAELTTLVEGESLFNDGVAIALYTAAVAALAAGSSSVDALHVTGEAVVVALGGSAIGALVAWLLSRLLRGADEPLLGVVGTLVAAYGSYLIADHLHVSGIFAAVVAGIGMRWFSRTADPEATIEIDRFWAVMAFIATSLVFVLMGIRISFGALLEHPTLVLATLAFVTIARVVVTYAGLPLAGIGRRKRAWQHVVLAAGMRGALSVALALGLPLGVPYRDELIDVAFSVVVLTLVVQGLAIGPLLVRLGLAYAGSAATTRSRPA